VAAFPWNGWQISLEYAYGIRFDHVRFDYPDSAHPTFDDITLTIRPGEHIALVAANGAGKTTLVKVALPTLRSNFWANHYRWN
jgi:ABC-type multidrug transport system fused ATPase/permease subunit